MWHPRRRPCGVTAAAEWPLLTPCHPGRIYFINSRWLGLGISAASPQPDPKFLNLKNRGFINPTCRTQYRRYIDRVYLQILPPGVGAAAAATVARACQAEAQSRRRTASGNPADSDAAAAAAATVTAAAAAAPSDPGRRRRPRRRRVLHTIRSCRDSEPEPRRRRRRPTRTQPETPASLRRSLMPGRAAAVGDPARRARAPAPPSRT